MRRNEEKQRVVIRFAGDSGDGIQLTGVEFSSESAVAGYDVVTLPSFPSEIRAPAGTEAGVSSYQIQFGSVDVMTPGDQPDVLVAMNPAAFKANIKDVRLGGVVVVNQDAFTEKNLEKVGYKDNPVEDKVFLESYRVYSVPMSTMCKDHLSGSGLSASQIERCKNYLALGLMFGLFNRSGDTVRQEVDKKFKKKPEFAEANKRVLTAGINYAESTEMFDVHFVVQPAIQEPGAYRNINGSAALAFGFLAAAEKSGLPLFYGAYPITPATDLLQELVVYESSRVVTFQAEDEIAALCSAIGAAYAGALAVTGSSGPGIALKTEALGLAVMAELPVVIVNVQRAGPSTGIPTKSEQADLYHAFFGRHGEAPLCVLAASSPSTAFDMAYEACRIAIKFMTPVILLSEGFINNTFGPWRIRETHKLPPFEFDFVPPEAAPSFKPYDRNDVQSRPWAIPGTPGLRHRVGGLERDVETGAVSNDGDNHERMCKVRAKKIECIADYIPALSVDGDSSGDVLVLGWGGTEGAIREAVDTCRDDGLKVSRAHLFYLNPFPHNLGSVLSSFKHVLVPELNSGQLMAILRAKYNFNGTGLNRLNAEPIKVYEIEAAIRGTYGK